MVWLKELKEKIKDKYQNYKIQRMRKKLAKKDPYIYK
jgi:hypothetical protein